jgi:hypothetical protein
LHLPFVVERVAFSTTRRVECGRAVLASWDAHPSCLFNQTPHDPPKHSLPDPDAAV